MLNEPLSRRGLDDFLDRNFPADQAQPTGWPDDPVWQLLSQLADVRSNRHETRGRHLYHWQTPSHRNAFTEIGLRYFAGLRACIEAARFAGPSPATNIAALCRVRYVIADCCRLYGNQPMLGQLEALRHILLAEQMAAMPNPTSGLVGRQIQMARRITSILPNWPTDSDLRLTVMEHAAYLAATDTQLALALDMLSHGTIVVVELHDRLPHRLAEHLLVWAEVMTIAGALDDAARLYRAAIDALGTLPAYQLRLRATMRMAACLLLQRNFDSLQTALAEAKPFLTAPAPAIYTPQALVLQAHLAFQSGNPDYEDLFEQAASSFDDLNRPVDHAATLECLDHYRRHGRPQDGFFDVPCRVPAGYSVIIAATFGLVDMLSPIQ